MTSTVYTTSQRPDWYGSLLEEELEPGEDSQQPVEE
jgi:hypothetical protein